MARSGMLFVVVTTTLAMLAMKTETAGTPPNCDSATTVLLPCYGYITGPDAKPPTDCCGGLSSLNTNSPACLCQLITQASGSTGNEPSVNITKALNLPKDCAITLKTSDCPALNNLPLAPPVLTPSSSAPTTASRGPTAGAGPVPGPEVATPGNGNDGSRLLPASSVVGAALAAAAVAVQAFL